MTAETPAELRRQLEELRAKVALVASPVDLGSVSVLFNMPEQYAKFLGAELIGLYKERLLVVMPAGFGLFRGGTSTAGEMAALQTIAIGPGPDGLAQAAIDAVKRLDDRVPPSAKARSGSARRGRSILLRYTVTDNSGLAGARLKLARGGTTIASFSSQIRPVQTGNVSATRWTIPRRLAPGVLSFCVVATDPAGNRSPESCAPIAIR